MLSKKKLTDIFLRKDDRQAPDSDIPFDENFFDLHSDFNGTNYSLISISATILKGAKANEKLNLRCKWFLKTLDDFKEIAEIKGTYYQPCVEDIGSMYRSNNSESVCRSSHPWKTRSTKESHSSRSSGPSRSTRG